HARIADAAAAGRIGSESIARVKPLVRTLSGERVLAVGANVDYPRATLSGPAALDAARRKDRAIGNPRGQHAVLKHANLLHDAETAAPFSRTARVLPHPHSFNQHRIFDLEG